MSIKLYVNTTEQQFKSFQFPAGELHVNVAGVLTGFDPKIHEIWIEVRDADNNDLKILQLLVNALTHEMERLKIDVKKAKFSLFFPYLPYSRQDRICTPGDPDSLNIFLDGIFLYNTNMKIYSVDVHNLSVCESRFYSRLVNKSSKPLLEKAIKDFRPDYLVCPDKGQERRFGQYSINFPYILCKKERDPATGKLSNFSLPETLPDLNEKRLLIYDDICDGGGTFIGLADLFLNSTLGLFVTHGIFSKGLVDLQDRFYSIYTTNSFSKNESLVHPLGALTCYDVRVCLDHDL